jgi:hypothetical protein
MTPLRKIPEIQRIITLFNKYRLFRETIVKLELYLTEFTKEDINRIRIAAQRNDLQCMQRLLKETELKYRDNLTLKTEGIVEIKIEDLLRSTFSFRGCNKKHIKPQTIPIRVRKIGEKYKLLEGKDIVYSSIKTGALTIKAEIC